MKTSELKKRISDMNLGYKETDTFIDVERLIRIYKTYDEIYVLHPIINIPDLYNLMKIAIEYSETPISEREEEKKYYIKMVDFFGDFNYLNHCKTKVAFAIGGKSESQSWKTIYTDKQISEMPIEIQKAIECGFLKKVEVVE